MQGSGRGGAAARWTECSRWYRTAKHGKFSSTIAITVYVLQVPARASMFVYVYIVVGKRMVLMECVVMCKFVNSQGTDAVPGTHMNG